MLEKNKRTDEQLLNYINKKFKTEFKALDDLDHVHIQDAYLAMGGSK